MSLVAIFQRRSAHTQSPRIKIRRRLLGRCAPIAALGVAAGLLSFGMVFAPTAHASTYTWDGTVNDWFAAPSHWGSITTGTFPGTGDDAVNNSTAAMTLGQSTTIQSFFSNGGFSLNAGTFSGSLANAAGTIQVNALFTLNGGQINNFTVQQGTGGSIVVTGSGGNDLINSVVNSSIDMSTNASAFLRVQGTTTVNGAITLATTGNSLDIYTSGDALVLGSTGSLSGFGNIFQEGGGALLTNNGIVNANTSGKVLSQTVTNFTNNGMAEATNGGTLALNNTLANTGALLADGVGSVITLVGTLTNGAGNTISTTNGGQIQVNGAALLGTINGVGATKLIFDGSNPNNFTNTTANINLDLSTNANAFLRMQGTNIVNGNITLATTSNGLDIYTGGDSLTLNGSLSGFGNVFQEGTGALLTNNGTVNANTSGKALSLGITTTTNAAAAILEATGGGILNFNSVTTTNSGKIIASGGGVVNLTGTLNSNTGNTINGVGGTVNVLGAALRGTINGVGATKLIFDGNGVNNFTNTTANINLDLATNANAFLRMQGTNTVNGNITLATTSNGLDIYTGGDSLTLNGSLSGFGNVFQEGTGALLTNNGTVNANTSGKALSLGITTTTNAAAAILEATGGGILNFNSTTTNNSGKIIASGGGVVNLTGTLNSNTGNTINGVGGTVNVLGTNLLGTINGVGATKLVFDGSGGNQIDNTTANINLDLATNANAFLKVREATVVNGAITLATTSNGLDIYTGGDSLLLSSTGSLTGFGSVYQEGTGAALTNNGTINANANGKTLSEVVTSFTNNGTAKATNGGTLALNNNIANSAGATIAATGVGSLVTLTGTLTGTGNNLLTTSGGGQIQVNALALRGTINTDAATTLIFNNSGANNLTDTTVNGNFSLTTDAFARFQGTDTVNGAITIANTSGGLDVYTSGDTLVLGSTGSLSGFGSVYQEGTGAALTNNGTINANSVGNTLNIVTTSFNNTGTTEVQNGAFLNVTSANTDSGNILVNTGGTATFSQGLTQTAGTTQVDGTLNSALTLTGGILKGKGTVVGNVVNNGGTIAPGDSPGKLAITGAFTQNSGTFSIEFNNTAHDVLAVSGLATTGGLLDVNYIGTGASTGVGSIFDILDYGSVATSLASSQFFSNQGAGGLITGHNGFTYMLINDTVNNQLQLKELTAGNPVPETSSVVSLGLLLALGLGALTVNSRRRKAVR